MVYFDEYKTFSNLKHIALKTGRKIIQTNCLYSMLFKPYRKNTFSGLVSTKTPLPRSKVNTVKDFVTASRDECLDQ